MHCCVLFAVACLLAGTFAEPVCDQQEPAKCTQPALKYFLQRYVERKSEVETDAIWHKDMTKQCELDVAGYDCLMEFSRRCLPAKQQLESANTPKRVSCEAKVNSLVTGCKANSSLWHRACQSPLEEQLHKYLTTHPSNIPSEVEMNRLHTRICCEIDHYTTCVTDKANAECNDGARVTFQEMFKDIHLAYQCDPAATFKGEKC